MPNLPPNSDHGWEYGPDGAGLESLHQPNRVGRLTSIADVYEPEIAHVPDRGALDIGWRYCSQLVHKAIGAPEVAVIELGSRQEIGLLGTRLIVQEILRNELENEALERFRLNRTGLQVEQLLPHDLECAVWRDGGHVQAPRGDRALDKRGINCVREVPFRSHFTEQLA